MLLSHLVFSFANTKPLNPPNFLVQHANLRLQRRYISFAPPKSYASDEFPVDETFLERFAPKDKETEDEARIKNWKLRGWAPWEEVLSYEADFARKSLDEGEEVPLQTPEALEAFRMLSPQYRQKKMEELGLTEKEFFRKQFDVKGEIPETLQTYWTAPVVATHLPPRDWPPRGWHVDRKELEYIRESHKTFTATRINLDELKEEPEEDDGNLDRYKAFLKQYNEWVEHEQDRLEQESYEDDQDYYPGRRKRGKDYKEGMYELPFYYPGQICEGKVISLALQQGAFVDVGGVHDGWVPIKGNDWYWIRHHIKVGMHVLVEIIAKRDPYRYRFPLEMRFVFPNIDHLIFNRFEYPPIFRRISDNNLDELRRDCGRPPVPKQEPQTKPEEDGLLSNHPYVDRLWQIHVAEQMIIDDVELNPEKYAGKSLSELSDDEDFDEENSVEYTKTYYKSGLLPQVILKTSVKELDLESAYQERQHHKALREEAIKRGEKYKIEKLKRNEEMDEYDYMHWRRSVEEREALMRDISCRQAHGLPLEEPGKFKPKAFFGKDQYDPQNPLYRYDYWGEPKNSEKSQQERMTDAHNKSIVGKGTVWYEMSYEDTIKQREMRESRDKFATRDESDESDGDEDDDDFDFSFLNGVGGASQPHVNGTQSNAVFDDGIIET